MNEVKEKILKYRFKQFDAVINSGQLPPVQQYETIYNFVYDVIEELPEDKQKKLLQFLNDYEENEIKLSKLIEETGTNCQEVYEYLKENFK